MGKKMTNKELQHLLDSFQKEVTKKDWEIDREARLKSYTSDSEHQKNASKSGIANQRKNKTGIFGFTDEQRSKYSSIGGKSATKEQKAKAGSIGDSSVGGSVTGNKVHTCEHCGESQKGNGFFRNHGNGKCLQTKKENEKIIELHLSGLKAHEIVSELGVAMGRVRKIVQAYKRNNK